MYEYQWKCMWGHVDPAGIAYYPRLVIAMHQAGEDFMDSIGVPYWDLPAEYGVHFPIVAMNMEFTKPVMVGDTITISVEPELGTKSLAMDFVATHEDGSVAYEGHEQHVCVLDEEHRSVEIPDEIRGPLEDALE